METDPTEDSTIACAGAVEGTRSGILWLLYFVGEKSRSWTLGLTGVGRERPSWSPPGHQLAVMMLTRQHPGRKMRTNNNRHNVTSQSSATKHGAKRAYQTMVSSPNRVWAAVGYIIMTSSFRNNTREDEFAQTQTGLL